MSGLSNSSKVKIWRELQRGLKRGRGRFISLNFAEKKIAIKKTIHSNSKIHFVSTLWIECQEYILFNLEGGIMVLIEVISSICNFRKSFTSSQVIINDTKSQYSLQQLPQDVLIYLFSFVDVKSIKYLSCSCKLFAKLFRGNLKISKLKKTFSHL
jgi:hypothetical protein